LHLGTSITDNTFLMKRSAVISPVLLLTIVAAVGAGYMPTDDPLQMFGAANATAMLGVRTQRQATRQWLDHVVKTFNNHRNDQHHLSTATFVTPLATALPTLHLCRDSHLNRVLSIDHPLRGCDWLLNLPPPTCL
jgi:hypothetical protein